MRVFNLMLVILITYGGVYILPDSVNNTLHTYSKEYIRDYFDSDDPWLDSGNVRRNNEHYYYSDWFIKGEKEHDAKYGKYKKCGDENCLYCVGQYIVN